MSPETLSNSPTNEQVFFHRGIIKGQIRNALEQAHLSSTQGLCHEINFAIALALSDRLGIELVPFSQDLFKNQDKPPCYAAFVFVGSLIKRKSTGRTIHRPHSYLLVLGTKKPILIDGANDQVRRQQPFLMTELSCETNFQAIVQTLLKDDRDIKTPWSESMIYDREKIDHLIRKTLQRLLASSKINQAQSDEFLRQYQLESRVAANYTVLNMMRDWLTYFTQALGIYYPSTQGFMEHIYNLTGNPNPHITNQRKRRLYEVGKTKVDRLI